MRVVEIAYNMNMSKMELRQVLKSDTYDEISFIAKEVKMSKSEVIQESFNPYSNGSSFFIKYITRANKKWYRFQSLF